MADVTPLARGPLSHLEMMVLAAVPLTSSTTSTDRVALVTSLDRAQVENALAHLHRRGLIHKAGDQVRLAVTRPPGSPPRRHHRPADRPAPTLPVA